MSRIAKGSRSRGSLSHLTSAPLWLMLRMVPWNMFPWIGPVRSTIALLTIVSWRYEFRRSRDLGQSVPHFRFLHHSGERWIVRQAIIEHFCRVRSLAASSTTTHEIYVNIPTMFKRFLTRIETCLKRAKLRRLSARYLREQAAEQSVNGPLFLRSFENTGTDHVLQERRAPTQIRHFLIKSGQALLPCMPGLNFAGSRFRQVRRTMLVILVSSFHEKLY